MSALNLSRLYRAFVSGRDGYRNPERTVFVEAGNRDAAVRKIAAVIVALEYGSTVESVSERIYNLSSAAECIEEGLGEDRELRLFETGWGKAISFVEHPLFLLDDPAPLIRKWAQIPQELP